MKDYPLTTQARESKVPRLAASYDHGNAHLRWIVDAVPVGISYLDREQRFQFANKAYQSLLGVCPEELIGKTLREAIGKEPYKVAEPFAKRALNGETARFETTLRADEAYPISISVTYAPDARPDKTIKGFFALVQDISDRARGRGGS